MKPKVLVVDDDPGIRYTLREVLEEADLEVLDAEDGEQALLLLADNPVDLVISDLAMPRMDGLSLLKRLGEQPRPPKLILITAHGSERQAVAAMKLGALDYFPKPFDIDEVVRVVERAVASIRVAQENELLRAELRLARHMVFSSSAMREIALLVERVASRDVTVLITGPSGTGKELLAEAIVAGSGRARKPFVRFNCAALPLNLVEAELFGHAKGAFTGAVRHRAGLFREAAGGTLLLDEIGELPIAVQSKLLRALQEKRVRPVGEDSEVEVDVRLLVSTNRDLQSEVKKGAFREDLYYRIQVVEIRIPPLSQRRDDIPLLVDHFLRKYAERFGTGPLSVAPAVLAALGQGDYPGNVRELEHRIERLVALSVDGRIDEGALQDPARSASSPEPLGLKERVDAYEKGLLLAELSRCKGNRSEAARKLRIGRVTLLDKLKKFGLE